MSTVEEVRLEMKRRQVKIVDHIKQVETQVSKEADADMLSDTHTSGFCGMTGRLLAQFFGVKKIKTPTSMYVGAKKSEDAQYTKIVAPLQQAESEIQSKIDKKMEEINLAKQQAVQLGKAGNKKKALEMLKRCKGLEASLSKMEAIKASIGVQIDAIEQNSMNHKVVSAMKAANKSAKKSGLQIDIKDVDKLQDHMEEMQESAIELGDALSRPMVQHKISTRMTSWESSTI